jgi:hypothetical protein
MNIWFIQTPFISYDDKPGLLIIKKPSLTAYDYKLFEGPDIKVLKNKVTNKMVAMPLVKFSSEGSFSIRAPILFEDNEQRIQVTPELNVEYGPGVHTKIIRDNTTVNAFTNFLKLGNPRSWFIQAQGAGEDQETIYHYQGAFLSDQELVYRYPDLTPNIDQLYTVSNGSLKKETPFGTLQFYSEKLYRYQEARSDQFVIVENLASLRLSNYQPTSLFLVTTDLFNVYQDKAYPRGSFKGSKFINRTTTLNGVFVTYPQEDFYQGLLDGQWKSDSYFLTKKISTSLNLLAKIKLTEGVSPLIDTVAMPIHYDSLETLTWHHGLDWGTNGLVLAPRAQWFSGNTFKIEAAINYALKQPAQPWEATDQPYLTTFRDNNRWSPLGIKLTITDQLLMSTLFDLSTKECVYGQLDYFYKTKNIYAYASVFYHHYYPLDTLSYTTGKIAQFNMGYYTKIQEPSQFFIETGFNLIPIELERFKIGWRYDYCCWESAIGFGCQKSYDPQTQVPKWNYSVSIKAELRALGFIDYTGRQKNVKYFGFHSHHYEKVSNLYRPGYL